MTRSAGVAANMPLPMADTITLRVTSPFTHRGERVLVGQIIQCTRDEAEGCLFVGWATPHLVNGHQGRHERRDMRAKP